MFAQCPDQKSAAGLSSGANVTQHRFKGVTVMPLQPARIGSSNVRRWMTSLKRLFRTCSDFRPGCCHCGINPAQASGRETIWSRSVNADPITRKTLAEACLLRYGSDVLDNMVNRHLILQACAHNGNRRSPKQKSPKRSNGSRQNSEPDDGKLPAVAAGGTRISAPINTAARSFGRCWRCDDWLPTRSR